MTDYTRLIKGLVPKLDGESAVRHRTALVDAVNADGTVDLDFDGTIIPNVSVLDGAVVGVADVVQVAVWAGDMLVLGRGTAGDEFIRWDGTQKDTLTSVTVTGSQAFYEGPNRLQVVFAGQGVQDYNCLLKPHAFTVGDAFTVPTRLLSLTTAGQVASAGLIFTAGTTAGSNAVAAHIQYNAGDVPSRVILRHGTLTAMSTVVQLTITGFYPEYWLRLGYFGVNQFLLGLALDEIGAGTTFGGSAQSKTMTPTHVGVCWSKDNTSGDGVASFGNVRKVA